MKSEYVGIDIGYGFLKVDAKDKQIVIPSVIGGASELTFKIKRDNELDTKTIEFEFDDEKYFVGDLAILQSDQPFRSLSTDRTSDTTTKVLFLTALALLTKGSTKTFRVVTGLPVKDYLLYKNVYIENYTGTYDVKINGSNKKIVVDKVIVVPQPYGTYCSGLFTADGSIDEDFGNNHTGIIDIGFKTSDFIQMKNITYVDKFSSTNPNGISTIYGEVSNYLNNKHGIFKEDYELEDVIKSGFLKTRKETIDLKPVIKEAKRTLAKKISNEVKSLWTNFPEITLILITGGGGALIYEELTEFLGEDIVIATNPQTANVIGYRQWGEYLGQGDE